MTISLDAIDLLEDAWADRVPHQEFDLLRREAPVFWHEEPDDTGFWVLTRHADVRAVSRDHETFSTELGGTFIPTQTPEALDLMRLTLLNMDPPKHNRQRRLVSAGFTPRMISLLIDAIRVRAEAIVDNVAAKGSCEFVEDIAAELPLQVICEMIGVPEHDRHQVFDWSNRLVGFQDPDFRSTPEDGEIAAMEMWGYCAAIAEERRAEPSDDIMSILVHAEIDGDRLTADEINMFFVLLAVAGNETTRNLIAHAMLAVIEHPEARADLIAGIDDDALWTTATEEFLRWGSSIQNFRRTATRDTEIAGTPIKKGDKVVTFYMAANRDPDVFPDPHRFDIRRQPNDHVTFGGGGVHFCLGANLARAEIKAMINATLRRLPDIELDGDVKRMRSDFINGIKQMPVKFSPA